MQHGLSSQPQHERVNNKDDWPDATGVGPVASSKSGGVKTSSRTLFSSPPQRGLRLTLRLPIVIYRLRLGWLLGERFVLLQHIGRKTGQPRQTVVEVVGHESATDVYYIASGWGKKSNWYQNLLAHPEISIQVSRRKLAVVAHTLDANDGARVLVDYRQKHPLAARELGRLMGLRFVEATPEELAQLVRTSLPIVSLQPRSASLSTK